MARTATKTPKRLRTAALTSASVLLAWRAVPGAASYVVFRDGKRRTATKATRFNDKKVKPGDRHRYRVRARGKGGRWLGPASKPLLVTVPKPAPPAPGPGGTPLPGGTTPVPEPGQNLPPVAGETPTTPAPETPMTAAMVTRLFWRAGFGPAAADLTTWTSKSVEDLVDHFLDTPQALTPTSTPPTPGSSGFGPIDPLAGDNDLVMEWVDHMQRAQNPFIERLTFFWHRHWAVSRAEGGSAKWIVTYRNLLRSYGDLATNPNKNFRQLAMDMTTSDGAMSYFLTMCRNQAGQVNENYAREFMELFCLGVTDAAGNENYSQTDVAELARAFTGWRLNEQPASPTFGAVTFGPGHFDNGTKTIFGQTGNWTAAQAVDMVLARPSHAPFLVRKLWGEFISQPIPQDTLDNLVAVYTAGGELKLKPLLRGILLHPLMFASIDEPDMIKPPIVLTVGILRAMDVPMRWFWIPDVLDMMQQMPYYPPNVAGWEGGLSWLNTNTVQARFELVLRALYLKHRGYAGGAATPPADIPGETAAAAYDRAYAAVGSPWLSAGTVTQLKTLASGMAAGTVAARAQRQYALRAYILAGPDYQVM